MARTHKAEAIKRLKNLRTSAKGYGYQVDGDFINLLLIHLGGACCKKCQKHTAVAHAKFIAHSKS